MDFYNIGAMKVFAQLGQLIEADEKTIVFSDLPHDLIHEKIGAYLLEDPNKKIQKIFKGKEDDDLQILLFGEVKDVSYVNIYDYNKEIDYKMNDKLKNYVNYIFKANKIKCNCEKMKCKFYIERVKQNYYTHNIAKYDIDDKITFKISFYDEIGDKISEIYDHFYYRSGFVHPKEEYETLLRYRVYKVEKTEEGIIPDPDKWNNQRIKKKDIINEYNEEIIKEEIIKKYF